MYFFGIVSQVYASKRMDKRLALLTVHYNFFRRRQANASKNVKKRNTKCVDTAKDHETQ